MYLNRNHPYRFHRQRCRKKGRQCNQHRDLLAFCFDNAKRCEQGTGNTPEALELAKKMATAWANFARHRSRSLPDDGLR